MSARYHQSVHVHPYPWSQVASAVFRRYPNPFATHVLSEDTLHRTLINDGDVLYSRRFLTKTNRLPKWGESYMRSFKKVVPLVEESVVDRSNRVVVTYTRNVGFSRFMTAVERVCYRESADAPDQTVAVKEAWIESGLYGLRSAVKQFGIERFKTNCQRATDGFNFVLGRLAEQQQFVSRVGQRKWQEMRERGQVIRGGAVDRARHAADVARAHTTVHASDSERVDGQAGDGGRS